MNACNLLKTAIPRTRHFDKRSIQPRNGRAAQQPKRALHVSFENLEGSPYSWFSRSRKPVGVPASDKHRSRTEADGLYNVAPPPYATIHQYFNLPLRCCHYLGKSPQRRRNRIKLSPTVV